MELTPNELGKRLKDARETNQISQERAAKSLGLSRGYITQIETGVRPINTLQLSKLAKLYGRNMADFFQPAMSQNHSALVLFRITQELKQNINPDIYNKNITLLREYTNLEKLLELNKKIGQPVFYDLASPQNKWEAIQMGQEVAEKERQRLQLGNAPIEGLGELLEMQGVRVLEMDMDEGISGLYISDEDTGLTVFINPKHHNFRYAFTLAHEYCHVLTDRKLKSMISSDQMSNDLLEIRANSFAAAFLMPRQGVTEFLEMFGRVGPTREFLAAEGMKEKDLVFSEKRTPSEALQIQLYDIVHLQHHYGVSWETAVYRLLNLHLISKDECSQFLNRKDHAKQLRELLTSKKDKPHTNTTKAVKDFYERFLFLCLDAFRQEIISYRKLEELSELINVNFKDLKNILLKLEYLKR